MRNRFGRLVRRGTSGRAAAIYSRAALGVLCGVLLGSAPVSAQEQLMFPAVQNAQRVLLEKIRNEQVRLDIAMWLLVDGEIVHAIINKHQSGVPVRVLGDRVSIFEADPNTRTSFIQLAIAGVPIRLRYHPTWFPEIMHWKSAIFVGQNTVEFGSANFTTFELAPWSSSNFKDETVLFSSDPTLVRAFMTMFDQMWADTNDFLDWPAAYRLETGSSWPHAMRISTDRLEPDWPTNVPGMVWSQGPELLSRMIAEIDAETQGIDLVSYRLTVPEVTDALIRRHRAGVPVRVFIEPMQYRSRDYPEYWLVGAMADRLWAAGVPIKQRAHEGLTHMKVLVTSRVAMIASANFTRFWQRDHNYFASASASPSVYQAMKQRFAAMWNDPVNYTPFQPLRPEFVQPLAPATNGTNISTSSTLVWRRTPWAVAFDVYMGRDPANLALAGRVNAVVTEQPPETYSFTPPHGLQPSTRYYWRIVARTLATDVNPALTTASEIFEFVTAASAAPPAPGPAQCVGPNPGPEWSCVKGAWLPPAGWAPPPPPAPPTSCPGAPPVQGWVCVNGGWLPPDHPLALGGAPGPAPAPVPPPSTCTTVKPATNWVCVNGGWLPPDSRLAAGAPDPVPPPVPPPAPAPGSCSTPDPFGALGGGVCIGGGWVPKGHPLAGSGGS